MAEEHLDFFKEILKEEVNVKQVEITATTTDQLSVVLDLKLTPELKQEGLMREAVRNIQQARKQAGLDVDDRIDLVLETTDDKLTTVLQRPELTDTIKQETLAKSLRTTGKSDFTTTVKIESADLGIGVTKL